MSQLSASYPTIKPSLNLDFARTKTLDPRVTFARASTATYFDELGILRTAAAGVARFDHNPTTGESLGLLIEEQRTNTIVSSSNFASGGWNVDGILLAASATIAPDGTLSATSAVQGAGGNRTYHFDNSGVTGSKVFSIYVKPNAGSTIVISAVGGLSPVASATINASTGVITGFTGASSVAVGNGWYRILLPVNVITASGNSTYWSISGPASSVFIWGAQLEAGAFATSYIPTVAASVTRAADSATMTGTNFSSWYRGDEGTIYAAGAPANSSAIDIFAIHNGTINERMQGLPGNSNYGFFVVSGGNTQVQLPFSALSTYMQTAYAYKINDFAFSRNGATALTDTSGLVPVGVNTLSIGRLITEEWWNGTIRKFSYYPARLTNAQLQTLTT